MRRRREKGEPTQRDQWRPQRSGGVRASPGSGDAETGGGSRAGGEEKSDTQADGSTAQAQTHAGKGRWGVHRRHLSTPPP